MRNPPGPQSPARERAATVASGFGLELQGLSQLGAVYWNLPIPALYEEAVFRREGHVAQAGAFVCRTGRHTGRSADDRYVVREPSSERLVGWGRHHRPFASEQFDALFGRLQGYLQGRDVFVQDGNLGADPEHRMPVRIVSELAWHSMFARHLCIPLAGAEDHRQHVPAFTVVVAPGFKGVPSIDTTASSTFVVLSLEKRLCLIGDTEYAGEIQHALLTALNFLLPRREVLPMQCAANADRGGDTALFFGLPGAGKTTLATDPRRGLVGDDAHGWSDLGVFNLEGGGHASVHRLSASEEPEIFATTRRFGTLLENVAIDPVTREIDLDDASVAGNARASYPLRFVAGALPDGRAGHPKHVVFLTCDASGVLPPISRLSPEQAHYQFLSGYGSKRADATTGSGREPEIDFDACFGGPFGVHRPVAHADRLMRRIERHGVTCWLVNTGWRGGPYGVGERIRIEHSRALLNAALSGELAKVKFAADPIFGFAVPTACPAVPAGVLDPASSWSDRAAYDRHHRRLAQRFVENFRRFEADCPAAVRAAGPRLEEAVAKR